MLTEVNVPIDETTLSRILERVVVDNESGCWLWQGSKTQGGHGQISVKNKTWGTHRIMFVKHKGPVPDGLMVLHSCDVSNCCNPEHLIAGTRSQNAIDAVLRTRHGSAKLKPVDVDEIRLRYWVGQKISVIAREMGISRSTVDSICRNKTWVDSSM